MNKKMVTVKGVVLSALVICTYPAASATNVYNGLFHAVKYNSGVSDIAMQPYSTSMCFLTRVGINETDVGGETSTCQVYYSNGWWRLQANVGSGGDNDAYCSAMCYTR